MVPLVSTVTIIIRITARSDINFIFIIRIIIRIIVIVQP